MAYQCLTKQIHHVRGLTRRQHQTLAQNRRIRFTRVAALMLLGGKCEHCGFNDMRALQIDHVLGDGKKEIQSMRGDQYYRHVMSEAHTGRYQVLCANHNWIKRAEREEHDRPCSYAAVLALGVN